MNKSPAEPMKLIILLASLFAFVASAVAENEIPVVRTLTPEFQQFKASLPVDDRGIYLSGISMGAMARGPVAVQFELRMLPVIDHGIGSALADEEIYAWLLKHSRRDNKATKP